jgi:uncharacterized phosphosugar-binding protein
MGLFTLSARDIRTSSRKKFFFRAGGIAAVNPILDERLIFLKGALESTRAERESGLAQSLIEREDIRPQDVSIIISNSGRNAARLRWLWK